MFLKVGALKNFCDIHRKVPVLEPSVRTTSLVDLLIASALTRGVPIWLGKAKVTTNFSIESSLWQNT